jgi:hypothetical protein
MPTGALPPEGGSDVDLAALRGFCHGRSGDARGFRLQAEAWPRVCSPGCGENFRDDGSFPPPTSTLLTRFSPWLVPPRHLTASKSRGYT